MSPSFSPRFEILSTIDLDSAGLDKEDARIDKLLKTAREFRTNISRNRDYIPNYGERYRNGEPISTGFVESAVNQVVSKRMAKKQQMQWSQRGPSPSGPHTSTQRRLGGCFPGMVSRFSASIGARSLIPRFLAVS
jgi:hypothetical protein